MSFNAKRHFHCTTLVLVVYGALSVRAPVNAQDVPQVQRSGITSGGPLIPDRLGVVGCMAFSPDGKRLVTGCDAGWDSRYSVAQIWDIDSGREHARLVAAVPRWEDGRIVPLPLAGDSPMLEPAKKDNEAAKKEPPGTEIIPWGAIGESEPLYGKRRQGIFMTNPRLKVHRSPVKGLGFLPDGGALVTAGGSKLCFWETESGDCFERIDGWNFQPSEYNAVEVRQDGSLQLRPVYESRSFNAVAVSPDGKLVATGGIQGLQVWDVCSSKVLFEVANNRAMESLGPIDERGIRDMRFSPNGKRLAVATGLSVEFWSVNLYLNPDSRPRKIALTACGGDGVIGQELVRGIRSIAYGPDSKILASAGDDGTVRIWDIEKGTMRIIRTIDVGAPVKCVAFSPDGKALVSTCLGSLDVRLWDAETGKELRRFEDAHKGAAHVVAFSPDGTTVAAAGSDATIILWNVKTGKERMAIDRTIDAKNRGQDRKGDKEGQ